ncbi:MAG: PQQ-binding-like beta-propeller repeat protein [Cyclobacteriaceae bacterium]
MKRTWLLLIAFFLCQWATAQEEMKEDFVTEIDHTFDLTQKVGDEYCYASSAKEISVFELPSGKLKWNKKYSELSQELSKVDDIISMSGSNAIFVFDRKMGKDKMACIDAHTGALLWVSAKYQDVEGADNIFYLQELDAFAITTKANLTLIKARTGEELWTTTKFKGVVGDADFAPDGSLILINMKPTLIGSLFSGLKNQIVRINVKNGDVMWDQTYRGVVEKKILTKEKIVDISVEEGKVFLYMNGIQVFDLNDGKPLWSAVYDMTPSEVVKNKKPPFAQAFGAYGVVAKPVVVGDYIYVLDMENKRNQYLKKIALKTGQVVWRSAEIKEARAIPGIYVVGDRVVLQVGGQVELQYITRRREGDTWVTERVIEFENVKPMNVQCFNAISGEQLWESDKMKKGLTNLFPSGNNVIVCSGKALYSIDINSGKESYEVELKDDGIGLADIILDYNDQVVIIGEKGVSVRNKADAKLTNSSKFKKSNPLSYNGKYIYGDRMALYTKNSDFAVYDLKSVKYKRFDARKGASAYISSDGTYLYVFESGSLIRKSKFTRLSVN